MAGHIQDRWYKTEKGPNGKPVRVRTERYGSGLRYRARYIGPDGTEKSKSFPDKQKRLAELWLAETAADMSRGTYVDPRAGRTTFKSYTDRWLKGLTTELSSQIEIERRLRLHALPVIGPRPLDSFRPQHIRELLATLEASPISASYARNIYSDVRAVLSAAVDDGLLARNPCAARTVRPPSTEPRRVVPWTPERVIAVRQGLSRRYRAASDTGAGCGLRQGEIFGLGEDAVDYDAEVIHVVRQVRYVRGTAVFAPPKGNKERDVPMSRYVAGSLRRHSEEFEPVAVTLPWRTPDGPLVTVRLLFTNTAGGVVWRSNFNIQEWKPALAAAGVIPVPEKGQPYASAREHGMHALRHFLASVLLAGGANIKAISEFLGHSDPALTLRVYAHLMPSSQDQARKVVDGLFLPAPRTPDGPETAQ
ncbi:tyrosine-type recombinase/integrase [Streptomyces sp. NPDC101158]|uniref:tyrosine-type recombinase/integrase n=1 Tax=Streptomyces sp. NPDC101158 TaxID=3366117 RepID=UPI0037F84A42